jgi:hypothetical protein
LEDWDLATGQKDQTLTGSYYSGPNPVSSTLVALSGHGPVRIWQLRSADPTSPQGRAQEADRRLREDYAALSAQIAAHNKLTAPSSWLMTSEHLFIEDDALMADTSRFSRRPGGLDLLLGKVLDHSTTDGELLIIAEILVWFGGHPEPGDDAIKSPLAGPVLAALEGGRAREADIACRAPVEQKIRDAADEAAGSLAR